MLRVFSDIWMEHFLQRCYWFSAVECFCGESSEVCSELTGASEVGIFAVVPTDLPQISENKYLLFTSMSLKFKLQLGIQYPS